MAQIWTFIFVAVLALAFGLAHSHDCDDANQRERRSIVAESEDATKD